MTLLLMAMLGLVGEPQEGASESVLGVLEHPQCREDPAPAVRPLFLKQGRDWVPLTSQEATRGMSLPDTWTVGLDGRSLGHLATLDPGFDTEYAWTFPRDRLLLLKPGQPVPEVANKQGGFAGWCDSPSRRPLVVVSRPAVRDPDRWKPYRPADAVRAQLFERFKAHAGPATVCLADSDTPKPFAYVSQDLIFFPSYRDRSGRKLVVMGLDARRNSCDGPPEPAWAAHAFVLEDEVRYLGRDLTLVDAGDYDADGTSELLFWYSAYNDDG